MLPEIMQWLKQTFAVCYNVMNRLDGHLWGDRYWSKILEGGSRRRRRLRRGKLYVEIARGTR
jgi:hypothetical protein